MANLGNNTNNVPFNSRIVRKGEAYGRNMCLTHDGDEPLVEFYDARYAFDKSPEGKTLGQFVSRYYVSTVENSDGINLEGRIDDWFVTAEQVAKALEEV